MKRILLTLLICIHPLLFWAQLVQDWKTSPRLSSSDQITNAIEASNGIIYAVGIASPGPLGKQDALLFPIDSRSGNIQTPSGNPLYFGGKFDERFNAVVQTNNGNIIMVGYTGTDTKGKRDAWMVCVNDKGKALWQQKFGTSGNDEFIDIVYDTDNNLLTTVGFQNDKKQGPLWVAQFRPGNESVELLTEKTYGRNKYSDARAMAIDAEKKIVITGQSASAKGRVYVLRLNKNLEQESDQLFAYENAEQVKDIITTQKGNYMIVGSTITRKEKENIWVVNINKYLEENWQSNYGGEDHDVGFGIAEAETGGFYLLGSTLSHKSTTKAEKIYLVRTDASGDRLYKRDYGGERPDIGKVALQLKNGQVFLASETSSDRAIKEDPVFMAMIDQEANVGLASGVKESVRFNREKNIQLNTPDGLLKPKDRTSIAVTIHNQSNIALPKVSVRIDNSGAKGVKFWQNNYLGKMAPNEKRIVHIPVESTAELESGKHDFNMTIMSGSATTLESSSFSISSKTPEPAFVELVDFTPRLVNANRGGRGEIAIDMVFKNTGDITANKVKYKAFLPQGLQAITQTDLIGTLPSTGERRIKFNFVTTSAYTRRDVTINIQISIDGKVQPKYIPLVINNVDNPSAGGTGGASNYIVWDDKRITNNGENKPISTTDPNYAVRVVMVSNKKVRTQDIKTYVNKNVVRGNKNFGEEELRESPQKKGGFGYIYERKIQLKQGMNEVFVQYGENESEKILINYQPRSRNLHVLAIGPTHPDLKYTSKDAKDFANAFKNQSGKLFNEVFVTELSTVENTEEGDIKRAMDRLKFSFQNGNIMPNDVVIVFISSHGIVGTGNSYKIIPSEFDAAFGDKYTIDYQRDILDVLNDVQCKKLIFVDACHSGAASSKGPLKDQRRSEMIFELNSQSPGLSSMVSCQSSEMSYEDEAWQNGAFTKAIIEGFNNTLIKNPDGSSYQASVNDDFITLGELYRFVRRRVLSLVSTYKPEAPTNQTPKLIQPENEGLSEDIPLFEVVNNN